MTLSFSFGGTEILNITNSSSDVVIKPIVDAKDIIIHQRDGTSLVEFNDGGYSKFTSVLLIQNKLYLTVQQYLGMSNTTCCKSNTWW